MIHTNKCNQCLHYPVCKHIESYRIACDIVNKTVDELPEEVNVNADIQCRFFYAKARTTSV